jgi:hypothetical protein
VVVGDFNTPLSPIDKSSKKKNQQRNPIPKCTIDQIELMYTEILPGNRTIYILLRSTWKFLQNRSYLRAQRSLKKYKKIEITL